MDQSEPITVAGSESEFGLSMFGFDIATFTHGSQSATNRHDMRLMTQGTLTMTPLPADRVLEQFFHECRSKLLDVAAIFDRLVRGPGAETATSDPRAAKLRQAVEVLLGDAPNKAELLQQLFSLPYDPEWKPPAPRF